jgi:membrane protein DedA with SNARE-associated domain
MTGDVEHTEHTDHTDGMMLNWYWYLEIIAVVSWAIGIIWIGYLYVLNWTEKDRREHHH